MGTGYPGGPWIGSVFVPEPLQTILVLVAGFFTGVLSGMFGVGGAVVSTPAIRVLGATPIEAIGSTLPSIIPSAVSGSLRYRREGLIHWRVVLWTALVGCVAAVGGALLADLVPGNGHLLMILTALLLAFTASRTAQSPRRPDPADAEEPPPGADLDYEDVVAPSGPPRTEWWRLALIGLAAGLLSGLLGVGGGIVMVPAFAGWVRLPIKEAVGCSLACVGILAVPGTDHAPAPRPHRLGVRAAAVHRCDPRRARSARTSRSGRPSEGSGCRSAIVLGAIAVVYAVGEVAALLCELAGPVEDRVGHRLGQLAGEGVLLARVEAAEDRRTRGRHLDEVTEAGPGPRQLDPRVAQAAHSAS